MTTLAVSIVSLPLTAIVAGENDRTEFPEAALRELAASIVRDGLAQPITVRPLGVCYQIVAGERRFRAHQIAGLAAIDCIVRELTDAEASRIMLAENTHRADLNPLEEAKGYESRMTRFGLSVVEVASWASVTTTRVRSRLELLTLRSDVQTLVASGQMPLGHATAMVGLDPNRQTYALRSLTEGGRTPTVAEFRLICGKLRAEQSQDSLAFGMIVEDWKAEAATPKTTLVLKTDPSLPTMRGAISVTQAMAQYLEDLTAGGHGAAALTVGTVFAGLLRSNLCRVN